MERRSLRTAVILLFVLGLWLTPGLAARSHAACGTSWTVEFTPNPSSSVGQFAAVAAVSDTETWAVGDYTVDETSRGQTLAEHWDGTSWTITNTPAGQNFSTLSGVSAVSSADAWAVGWLDGLALILHWDGTSWTEVQGADTGTSSLLSSVRAVSASDVWAVGEYVPPGGRVIQGLAEHWDGSDWSIVPTPPFGGDGARLLSVGATATDDVWAVGVSLSSGGKQRTLTEHWDGGAWTVVPSPSRPGHSSQLTAVAAVSPGRAIAVGWYLGNPQPNAIALEWDGVAWRNVQLGLSDNTVVYGVTASADVAVAVGGHNQKTMAVSVGGGGGVLQTPNPGTYNILLAASSTPSNQVVAAGFETSGSTTNPLIERRCA